jgi:hypothetical protein
MSLFTPAHLGKWEPLYTRLIEGESMPLTEDAAWMLGRKTGIIAVLHEGEPIYIESTRDIGRTIGEYLSGAGNCEFRFKLATVELGASSRNAMERARKGPLADRINKLLPQYRFTAVPATDALAERLSDAFTVVADPRLNGPTARSNAIIDALPR